MKTAIKKNPLVIKDTRKQKSRMGNNDPQKEPLEVTTVKMEIDWSPRMPVRNRLLLGRLSNPTHPPPTMGNYRLQIF